MMATLTIPDNLYEQLRAAATRQHRPVEDLLREAIETVARPDDSLENEPTTRDEAIRRVRDVLGDDLESGNTEVLPPHLRPHELPVDHAALRASMPVLDPPLSVTVADERDDRV
jgi:hypothetical protein